MRSWMFPLVKWPRSQQFLGLHSFRFSPRIRPLRMGALQVARNALRVLRGLMHSSPFGVPNGQGYTAYCRNGGVVNAAPESPWHRRFRLANSRMPTRYSKVAARGSANTGP